MTLPPSKPCAGAAATTALTVTVLGSGSGSLATTVRRAVIVHTSPEIGRATWRERGTNGVPAASMLTSRLATAGTLIGSGLAAEVEVGSGHVDATGAT